MTKGEEKAIADGESLRLVPLVPVVVMAMDTAAWK